MFDFTKEQIFSSLEKHEKAPAVKISAEKVAEMKANPLLKRAFETLEKCRDFYRERPFYAIPFSMFKRFEADGDRTEFEYHEKGYFMHRGHLKTWGLSTLFFGNDSDVSMLEDAIWAICDEFTWSLPAHMKGSQGIYESYQPDRYTIDLFAAETGQALAEIIQIVGDRLNPLVVKRAKREIQTRIIDRYLYNDLSEFSWSKSTNNWAAVCAGSVGMAAICELDDNEKLAEIIEKLLISLRTFISGFSEDGACLEGTGYWSYGFGYFSCFADMLYRRTGGEIDLFADETVHRVALFPTKTFFYGSRTVSFSDAGSKGGMGLGITTMLASHYPDMIVPTTAELSAGVETTGCHRFALNLRSFLWAGSERPAVKDCSAAYPLPYAQWYIANGANNVGFAAKAGNNGEPHNHNDVGHFITFKNGDEFFCDLGSGEYSKQYFSKERYTFLHCGAHGHSLPVINGEYQKAGRERAAKNVSVTESGISMDIAGTYEIASLEALKRDFVFDKENSVVTLKDKFVFNASPEKVAERFITKIEPKLENGKVTLTSKNGEMSLYYDEAAFKAVVSFEDVADHSGKKTFRCYLIDLEVISPEKEMEFTFTVK